MGLIGGIVFLILITPRSPWTLHNPIMAAGLGVILRRRGAQSR